MKLVGQQRVEYTQRLLNATEEGPITLWTERIAQLAKEAGVPPNAVDWSGSPKLVASKVLDAATSYEVLPNILERI